MLNELPNNNDATRVGYHVRLTAVGARQFSMEWWLYTHHAEKPPHDLPETRDNDMITRKVRADGNKLCPGKEWRLYTQ